jgi:diguanylate cyclase (GGDEF)-like protein
LQYRRLAFLDPLTGLLNRSRFTQALDDAVKVARRRGEEIALLFLDLDGFKDVNDTLGHNYGDLLLCEVGRRLRAQVREVDLAARLGGDEFCLLLTQACDGAHAAHIAQRCLDALEIPFDLSGSTVRTKGSIGIALFPGNAGESDGLLKAADVAMYAAKQAGKHRFAFYSAAMTKALEHRLALESALREAVRRGEFELHYQPRVSLVDGRMLGAEALLRWRRPGTGLVAPDDFIALAERLGLIQEIGVWVLENACRQAVQWRREGLGYLEVAVNISPSHFGAPGFAQSVKRVLEQSDMAPDRLEIEITEAITRNPKQHALVCQEIRHLGVRIAIDDFGVGYSSISLLKHMPVSTLKLDQHFIRDLATNTQAPVLVGTIIGTAIGLGFNFVAEGVETLEQVQILKGLGCTSAQGYYFSRPVPAAQIPALARANFLQGTPQYKAEAAELLPERTNQ